MSAVFIRGDPKLLHDFLYTLNIAFILTNTYLLVTEFEGCTVSYGQRCIHFNREFKVYDATVSKTSLKIASSSLSIVFFIM